MERNESSLVFGMNVGAFREEKLDDSDPIVAGGEVEGGAVPAFKIATVDDVRVAQHYLLYQLEVAWKQTILVTGVHV